MTLPISLLNITNAYARYKIAPYFCQLKYRMDLLFKNAENAHVSFAIPSFYAIFAS